MKNNYEWEESKFSLITRIISLIIFIIGTLSMIIFCTVSLMFKTPIIYAPIAFCLGFVITCIFVIISELTSTCKKYSILFIDKINQEFEKCTSLEDLIKLRTYFHSQAVDESDDTIRLSYPYIIRELNKKINNQINQKK